MLDELRGEVAFELPQQQPYQQAFQRGSSHSQQPFYVSMGAMDMDGTPSPAHGDLMQSVISNRNDPHSEGDAPGSAREAPQLRVGGENEADIQMHTRLQEYERRQREALAVYEQRMATSASGAVARADQRQQMQPQQSHHETETPASGLSQNPMLAAQIREYERLSQAHHSNINIRRAQINSNVEPAAQAGGAGYSSSSEAPSSSNEKKNADKQSPERYLATVNQTMFNTMRVTCPSCHSRVYTCASAQSFCCQVCMENLPRHEGNKGGNENKLDDSDSDAMRCETS